MSDVNDPIAAEELTIDHLKQCVDDLTDKFYDFRRKVRDNQRATTQYLDHLSEKLNQQQKTLDGVVNTLANHDLSLTTITTQLEEIWALLLPQRRRRSMGSELGPIDLTPRRPSKLPRYSDRL